MGTHIYTDSETERRLVTYKSLAAKASAYKKSTSPTNKRKALTLEDINEYFNTTTESSSTAGIYVKYSVKSGKNAYINRQNVIERDLYINEGSSPTPSTKYKVRVIYESNGTNAYLDKGTFISSGEYYEKNFSSQSLIFESVSNISNDTPCSVNGSIITAGPITANTDLKVVISSGTPSEDTSITWQVNYGSGDNRLYYKEIIEGPNTIAPGTEFSYTIGDGNSLKWVYLGNGPLSLGNDYTYNTTLQRITVLGSATQNATDNVIIYVEGDKEDEGPDDQTLSTYIDNPIFEGNVDLTEPIQAGASVNPSTLLLPGYTISQDSRRSSTADYSILSDNKSIKVNKYGSIYLVAQNSDNQQYDISIRIDAVYIDVTLNNNYTVYRTGDGQAWTWYPLQYTYSRQIKPNNASNNEETFTSTSEGATHPFNGIVGMIDNTQDSGIYIQGSNIAGGKSLTYGPILVMTNSAYTEPKPEVGTYSDLLWVNYSFVGYSGVNSGSSNKADIIVEPPQGS